MLAKSSNEAAQLYLFNWFPILPCYLRTVSTFNIHIHRVSACIHGHTILATKIWALVTAKLDAVAQSRRWPPHWVLERASSRRGRHRGEKQCSFHDRHVFTPRLVMICTHFCRARCIFETLIILWEFCLRSKQSAGRPMDIAAFGQPGRLRRRRSLAAGGRCQQGGRWPCAWYCCLYNHSY